MSARAILVVTPTLGESPHLAETVESVASLRPGTLHVLSAPAGMLAGLSRRFPECVAVADRGRGGGIYGALNAALGSAPGGWEWFTYINDDDLLLPGFSRLAASHFARRSPEPVAYGDVDVIRADGSRVGRVTTERTPRWIPALLQAGISPLMQQGTLFSRETVGRLAGFDERYRLCADLDFWLRAYASGAAFRHHPFLAARFRLRPGQLSSDTSLTAREQADIVSRLLPSPVPARVRWWASLRYRACNMPRYLERLRTSGLRTSYGLLAEGKAGP